MVSITFLVAILIESRPACPSSYILGLGEKGDRDPVNFDVTASREGRGLDPRVQCFVRGGTWVNVSLWPVGSKWLPSGLREAIGCVCVEERQALDRGTLPSDGDREKKPCRTDRGLASFRWVRAWLGCMCVGDLPILPNRGQTQGPGTSREGISFWFSRLNAEVSVN